MTNECSVVVSLLAIAISVASLAGNILQSKR
jgi:hypothetical protein